MSIDSNVMGALAQGMAQAQARNPNEPTLRQLLTQLDGLTGDISGRVGVIEECIGTAVPEPSKPDPDPPAHNALIQAQLLIARLQGIGKRLERLVEVL